MASIRGVHFVFNKLATLRCREAFFDTGKEAGFIVKVAGNNIRSQVPRVRSRPGGDLCSLL
jgi:hypothetical protein